MTVTATRTELETGEGDRTLVMGRLRAASAGVREAEAAVHTATEHLAMEIIEARRAGVTWDAVAAATNLTRYLAMELARQTPPAAELPASVEPSEGDLLMSVPEYALHAGISEMTVYKRIKRGELPTTYNTSRRIRIIVAASSGTDG